MILKDFAKAVTKVGATVTIVPTQGLAAYLVKIDGEYLETRNGPKTFKRLDAAFGELQRAGVKEARLLINPAGE